MIFFVANKIDAPYFYSQFEKKFALINNIGSAGKYAKVIKYSLNIIILSLKKDNCIFIDIK